MKTNIKVGDYVFIGLLTGVQVGQILKIVHDDEYPYKISDSWSQEKGRKPYYSRARDEIQKLTKAELAWYLVTHEN